jgi:DNA modification methylase/transcriptional regulator with XRE-family HTH domain
MDLADAGQLVRERRLQIGLGLKEAAEALGVSKSYLSMIESGKRVPTDRQISSLSGLLSIPSDLIRVGFGRLPSDVAAATEERAAAITTAVRQSQGTVATEFADRLPEDVAGQLVQRAASQSILECAPYSDDLRVGKNSTPYRTHSYHTKVPPGAITPLIEHYTNPGGIVLDPFCGSGMTGVAALSVGRNAILSDVSPAAAHISRNYTTPCDPAAVRQALEQVAAAVEPTMAWLYEVTGTAGIRAVVEYTVWSDVFACSKCQAPLVYWQAARGGSDGAVQELVRCTKCESRFDKRELRWIGERAVESNLSSKDGRRRDVHPPTEAELALIAQAEKAPLLYWTPDVPFEEDREMWRAGHRAAGIGSVADFYTKRNLHALAALRHAILGVRDQRVRDALLFAFTASVNRASKRYQWNVKRPTNVMTGTLYVSSLRYEWNVWSLFYRKAKDVIRYYEHLGRPQVTSTTLLASATNLSHVPDGAIDFVFMDPPFGSNIYYADSSLLWEAWLGRLTDQRNEMVVNKKRSIESGGKTLEGYGKLMTSAFAEVRRVLRPGGYAVLAFNNTDAAIWTTVQDAIADANLEIASTAMLDKVHPSIKGVKGLQGKEQIASVDAVISLRASRRKRTTTEPSSIQDVDERVSTILGEYLAENTHKVERLDRLFSVAVRRLLEQGVPVSGVTMDVVSRIYSEIAMSNRPQAPGLFAREETVAYQRISAPYRPADEYVGSAAKLVAETTSEPPKRVSEPMIDEIKGERNTALYNAHSYHTKVPPEAITPFIEHFTRPGAIVLDPFSGSGMTGVAAALTGRRAVLNDLSVVAAHLGFNHTRRCDPEALLETFQSIYDRVRPEFERIYHTTHASDCSGYVHYTIWSPRYACPACQHEFSMWEVVDRESGRIGTDLRCSGCKKETPKRQLRLIGNLPASVNYQVKGSGSTRRIERLATPEDLRFIESFRREDIRSWYPDVSISARREMYIRCALHLQGINAVADFYTPRNLLALSRIWEEVAAVPNPRLRQALAFAFSNVAWHGTRMRRYNARGGQRPLTGTLYIPQLSVETNVLEVMAHKVQQIASYYRAFAPNDVPAPVIRIGSATSLGDIPSESIDYVFTDPPFGSNIFYADCNLIWESWLGGITNAESEAVVNRSLKPSNGGKTVDDYQQLMLASLQEAHRVLKPGAWMTLVFHNTDEKVWAALQAAAMGAGFEIEQAANLNRKQQSHKGYKGRAGAENVAHFDVIVSMRKLSIGKTARDRRPAPESMLASVVSDLKGSLPPDQFTVQRVHSGVLRRLATEGFDLSSITFEKVKTLWAQARPK